MVTTLSEILTASGGAYRIVIHDLPLPGKVVRYAAEIDPRNGRHLQWRFGLRVLSLAKKRTRAISSHPSGIVPVVW